MTNARKWEVILILGYDSVSSFENNLNDIYVPQNISESYQVNEYM